MLHGKLETVADKPARRDCIKF